MDFLIRGKERRHEEENTSGNVRDPLEGLRNRPIREPLGVVTKIEHAPSRPRTAKRNEKGQGLRRRSPEETATLKRRLSGDHQNFKKTGIPNSLQRSNPKRPDEEANLRWGDNLSSHRGTLQGLERERQTKGNLERTASNFLR